jgi:hypothetical protein
VPSTRLIGSGYGVGCSRRPGGVHESKGRGKSHAKPQKVRQIWNSRDRRRQGYVGQERAQRKDPRAKPFTYGLLSAFIRGSSVSSYSRPFVSIRGSSLRLCVRFFFVFFAPV